METIWDQVARHGGRTATAAVGERPYTYQELLQRAEDLASSVSARVGSGALLALDSDSPVSAAVTMLAAARAGCAVLPVPRDSPPARWERIFEDARPALLIAPGRAEDGDFTVTDTGLEQRPHAEELLRRAAYVIYTSGSTGQPKGVVVPHDALLARLRGLAQVPGLAAGESIVAMTSLSFDISLAEFLLPLVVGGRFVTAPPHARRDPDVFETLVDEYAPDVIQATPSFWRLLMAGGWSGAPHSTLWCGGETLTPHLARQLLAAGKEVWNLYGPTEATIWATAARVTTPERISLGDPLPGSRLCLDATETQGSSPEGEILLYGEGLAAGYLGREALTGERFGVHPTPEGHRRVYRTGDRARLRGDGDVEFLGRRDDQIKLRGHRIELGEIEAVLEEHPAVREAVAVLRDPDRPERSFVEAVVVPVADSRPDHQDLRGWLRERLPAGHCPGKFTFAAGLPRTSAGKIDRARLRQSGAASGAADGPGAS
ncbi:amino acid adenylation domain-containing protein [Streptomyces albus]|uniref:amino acid adenylation domain-containing protein n=1 Tax=Streptomyces albus TaxID=1888 RepID=UPI0033E80202